MRYLLALLLLALPLAAQSNKNSGARWDQVYLSPDGKVPVNPSTLVLEATANLKAGVALDVGMGNGRNAIYLARKGWKVTGVDISQAAVKQAPPASGTNARDGHSGESNFGIALTIPEKLI